VSKLDDIENQIITLMKADSDFDDVNFVRGAAYMLPVGWFPVCEVYVFQERALDEETGFLVRQFRGVIQFSDYQADGAMTLTSRVAVVTAYAAVREHAYNCADLFRQSVNRDLADLSGTDWAVRRFDIINDIEYGFSNRTQRVDDYENFAKLEFVVETQEAKA
jgi:hypothetical protein